MKSLPIFPTHPHFFQILFTDIKNLLFTTSFLFVHLLKSYLLLEAKRPGSFCETQIILVEMVKIKKHTHTHTPNTLGKITLERVSMKITDTPPPLFLNNLPLPFYEKKIWTPTFYQNFKNSTSPFIKGEFQLW